MSETEQPKKRRTLRTIGFVVLGLLFLCVVVAVLTPDKEDGQQAGDPIAPARAAAVGSGQDTPVPATTAPKDPPPPSATLEPTSAPPPTETPEPTHTLPPTVTPTATHTLPPTETPEPTATPEPLVLEGSGQWASDEMALPWPITVAHITHNGQRNLIIKVYSGSRTDLLVNEIGPFDGTRPIATDGRVLFDIDADGAWSITMMPLGTQDSPAFTGRGQQVSGLFEPPSAGPWSVVHDGQQNFIVKLHCAGGSDLVQNEIGPVDGSRIVDFERGPCFWEVVADGSWSLAPR